MSDGEREKWERRYADGLRRPRDRPAPFLATWIGRIPAGRALDVACGTGRNALLLAEAGFGVDAIDISQTAIDIAASEAARRDLDVSWSTGDLDHLELPSRAYDMVTVIGYRNRELWPRLVDVLAPDGWVLVEHHMKTRLEAGGPRDPAFRLDPRELLEAFSSLRVVHYSESVEEADEGGSIHVLERLVACNGDPGW